MMIWVSRTSDWVGFWDCLLELFMGLFVGQEYRDIVCEKIQNITMEMKT